MTSRLFYLIFLCLCLAASPNSNSETAQPALDFTLPRWKTGEGVNLADFLGQIVILDFFAYWCAPCRRASTELEENFQKYYATNQGNPHGIPVRVLSINIEMAVPNRTQNFIEKTGISEVLHDPEAKLLDRFGGVGIPFLVILDGSKATPASPLFHVVYKNAGFEGTGKLRHIIDSIGTGSQSKTPAQHDPDFAKKAAVEPGFDRVPLVHKLEADFESLWSSDILLTQSGVNYGQSRPSTEWNLGFSYGSIDFDYRPVSFDFLGSPVDVLEDRLAAQANWQGKRSERLTVLGSAGLYDGFTDYRSAWLNEYYRQQFSTLPTYQRADPKGWNFSAGLRWEYLPSTSFLQADLAYMRDNIAPGYEIDFDGLFRGRETLRTYAVSLSSENILTPRFRALNQVYLLDTTERELRFTYQTSLNWALGERWVWRSYAGLTLEDPDFEAYFVGSTMEYEYTPTLLLGVNGRFYRDSGEIENSLLFSAAAPRIYNYQAGFSLRWLKGESVLKITAAPYFMRYAPTSLGTAFFSNLYKDRDWGIAQIAYSVNF